MSWEVVIGRTESQSKAFSSLNKGTSFISDLRCHIKERVSRIRESCTRTAHEGDFPRREALYGSIVVHLMQLYNEWKLVDTWLGEICSCSCLTIPHGSGWVLLNKIFSLLCTDYRGTTQSIDQFSSGNWKKASFRRRRGNRWLNLIPLQRICCDLKAKRATVAPIFLRLGPELVWMGHCFLGIRPPPEPH